MTKKVPKWMHRQIRSEYLKKQLLAMTQEQRVQFFLGVLYRIGRDKYLQQLRRREEAKILSIDGSSEGVTGSPPAGEIGLWNAGSPLPSVWRW